MFVDWPTTLLLRSFLWLLLSQQSQNLSSGLRFELSKEKEFFVVSLTAKHITLKLWLICNFLFTQHIELHSKWIGRLKTTLYFFIFQLIHTFMLLWRQRHHAWCLETKPFSVNWTSHPDYSSTHPSFLDCFAFSLLVHDLPFYHF